MREDRWQCIFRNKGIVYKNDSIIAVVPWFEDGDGARRDVFVNGVIQSKQARDGSLGKNVIIRFRCSKIKNGINLKNTKKQWEQTTLWAIVYNTRNTLCNTRPKNILSSHCCFLNFICCVLNIDFVIFVKNSHVCFIFPTRIPKTWVTPLLKTASKPMCPSAFSGKKSASNFRCNSTSIRNSVKTTIDAIRSGKKITRKERRIICRKGHPGATQEVGEGPVSGKLFGGEPHYRGGGGGPLLASEICFGPENHGNNSESGLEI